MINDLTLSIYHLTPVINDLTLSIYQLTPMINDLTPSVYHLTLVINHFTLMVNGLTPMRKPIILIVRDAKHRRGVAGRADKLLMVKSITRGAMENKWVCFIYFSEPTSGD